MPAPARLTFIVIALVSAAAALTHSAPAQAADRAAHGEYLVSLLGCGRCHTEGYLLGGEARGPHLAGSRVGIAYSDEEPDVTPGLAFAPNLTPDPATGLGSWTQRDIVRTLTTGIGTDGHQRLPVMPWLNYGALNRTDLEAIAAYLKSLPPVARTIPRTTAPGEPVEHPYVRFGVYVFMPFDQDEPPDDEPAPSDQPL